VSYILLWLARKGRTSPHLPYSDQTRVEDILYSCSISGLCAALILLHLLKCRTKLSLEGRVAEAQFPLFTLWMNDTGRWRSFLIVRPFNLAAGMRIFDVAYIGHLARRDDGYAVRRAIISDANIFIIRVSGHHSVFRMSDR